MSAQLGVIGRVEVLPHGQLSKWEAAPPHLQKAVTVFHDAFVRADVQRVVCHVEQNGAAVLFAVVSRNAENFLPVTVCFRDLAKEIGRQAEYRELAIPSRQPYSMIAVVFTPPQNALV